MSVYNLQDEVRLGALLASVEGLNFEKVSAEVCDGVEAARYYMSFDEISAGGHLLGRIAQFVQENENLKIRFCKSGSGD